MHCIHKHWAEHIQWKRKWTVTRWSILWSGGLLDGPMVGWSPSSVTPLSSTTSVAWACRTGSTALSIKHKSRLISNEGCQRWPSCRGCSLPIPYQILNSRCWGCPSCQGCSCWNLWSSVASGRVVVSLACGARVTTRVAYGFSLIKQLLVCEQIPLVRHTISFFL